jgi:type II secretory pathway pseudopilin PulG
VNALRRTPFSLLELIVVMVLLTSAMAMLAPSLGGFFRGRRLDDEARRLWALTRYAQEQAITSAVPVAVWVDSAQGKYGLEAEPGYGYTVAPLSYELIPEVEVTAPAAVGDPSPPAGALRLVWWPDGSLAEGSASAWRLAHRRLASAAWTLTRNAPLSTFTLAREGDK